MKDWRGSQIEKSQSFKILFKEGIEKSSFFQEKKGGGGSPKEQKRTASFKKLSLRT